MQKWPYHITVKFLELYEQRPCLWDHKLLSYKSRTLRERALQEIADIMSEYVRDINIHLVKEKIRGIRNFYLVEHHKVVRSYKEATSEDDIYTPSLAWYPVADRFLRRVVETKDTKNSTEIIVPDEEYSDLSYLADAALGNSMVQSPATPVSCELYDTHTSTDGKRKSFGGQVPPVKKMKVCNITNAMTNAVDTLSNAVRELHGTGGEASSPESQCDEFEAFGNLVAAHLKKLPGRTALVCQMDIMKYLVEQRGFSFPRAATTSSS